MRAADARLHSAWPLQAGQGFRLGDVDRDGCPELLLGEVFSTYAPLLTPHDPERVVALDPPLESGPIVDAGATVATAGGDDPYGRELSAQGLFGWDMAVDEDSGSLLVGAPVADWFDVGAFPLDRAWPMEPTDVVGRISRESWRDPITLLSSNLGIVVRASGTFVWTSHFSTDDFAGEVYLWALPLRGPRHPEDVDAIWRADAGDHVQSGVDATSDLDGDGLVDFIVGAKGSRDGQGRIAILVDPLLGEHRIWDLAAGTIDGTVPEGRLGDHVASADLDGDGTPEVLSGSATVSGPSAFRGFSGPHDREREESEAEWSVLGDGGIDRTGVSQAGADLDGDGAVDLIVGRPGNPTFGGLDGEVLVFRGPVEPGEYAAADADLVYRNPAAVGVGDFFGYFVRAGDLDLDGADELFVSALRDRHDREFAGAVHVVHGRPDLFSIAGP